MADAQAGDRVAYEKLLSECIPVIKRVARSHAVPSDFTGAPSKLACQPVGDPKVAIRFEPGLRPHDQHSDMRIRDQGEHIGSGEKR
jgi:hypothetical protein